MYLARLKAVVSFMAKPNKFHTEPYPKLRWEWELKIPGRAGTVPYSTFTSFSLHPKSHLPGLLKAINITPDANGAFEESDCVGKVCMLLVEEVMGSEGAPFNQTEKYFPKAAGGAAPAPVAPAPAPVAQAPTPAPATAPRPQTTPSGVAVMEAPAPAAEENPFESFGDDDSIPF